MNERLKERIMRRVRAVYYLRMFVNPFAFKMYALIFVFAAVASLTSIEQIILNMEGINNAAAFYGFARAAFANTESVVQVLSSGALILSILALLDLARPDAFPHSLRRA